MRDPVAPGSMVASAAHSLQILGSIEQEIDLLHPIDVHVGNRVRQRRALLGMSQTVLAKAVGLTFQQVQKYERGSNRVSSSRLYEFAKVLDVPVAFFFEEMGPNTASGKRKPGRPSTKPSEEGISTKRETLELVRAYYKIRNAEIRDQIRSVVQALAKE